jgi:hypothetical protein
MAEDSKEVPQALPQVPPEVSLVIIPTKEGGTREMLRGSNGAFVKKKRNVVPSIEFTRKERKILYSPNKAKDGMTEHEVAFRNILRIAQGEGVTKEDMASVKAYEVMMRRALGKEAPSEQELDRMERQPVTAIFVQAPQIMHPEVVDGDKVKDVSKKPDFAEVISIVTNEK